MAILAFCIALFSACASAASYSTQLSVIKGLAPGDPVTYRGLKIGRVDSVTPLAGAANSVGFTVDAAHRALVRQDSIMVLHDETGTPMLALYDSDPNSPVADPGMSLRGAADQQQADMLVMNSGMAGLAASIAALSNAMKGSTAATANTLNQTATTAQQFERELLLLQQAAVAAGASNLGVINQQAQKLQQQYQTFAQQLAAQGNSAEAKRLRDEMDQLMRTLHVPSPTPTPSSTLTVPRAVPPLAP